MKFPSLLLAFCLAFSTTYGQSLWRELSDSEVTLKNTKEREIIPESYAVFTLDFTNLTGQLSGVNKNNGHTVSSTTLNLPLPNGELESFRVSEAVCMSPALSKKFPGIRCFSGVSTANPRHQARIDYGTMGFHAVIYTSEGTVYIDPYFKNPDAHYISYFVRDHKVDTGQFDSGCGVEAYEEAIQDEDRMRTYPGKTNKSSGAEEQIKRKYRLAVTTTGEWGQSFGTVENVMSRIVTGVNRINMIFENEVATTFELIDRNDELIFLDPASDPFVDANLGRSLIGQNSIAINNIVGSSAYDIGHVFTVRCTDGVAGIAALGSVCLNNKGNGVSCVGGSNISFFMVNTTAHEIGHQFNGGHSWSNCPSSMGQLSPGSAWEPGSGSTILSYAGVCGSQNILSTNDDYFHVGNISQFIGFINTTGGCAEETPSGNHIPDITVGLGDGVVIPIATPFELEGTATDEDGDFLTYNWEQMNLGPTSPLGQPMGNAPSFRSFPPSDNPKRLFPRLPAIIGGIGSNVEVLPLYSRTLKFRFVVRDNHPGAGAITWEEIEFNADESAGPFRVLKPNSLTFGTVGESLTIEWDVANTDNDIINCQQVDIYFSTDNGQTFPIVLARNTPNDGSETVVLPNIVTDEGKIKVKASNNIFFQLNRSNIVLREPSEPGFYLDIAETDFDLCLPEPLEVDVQGTSFQAFDSPVSLELLNVPAGVDYSFTENPIAPGGNATLQMNFDGITSSQDISVRLIATAENADTVIHDLDIKLTGTKFDDLVLQEPASGLTGLRQIPVFRWTEAKNADTYTLEIATSPAFGSSNVVTESFLPDTSFIPQVVLDNSQVYYWRVISTNNCISRASEIRTFGTASLDCKTYNADNLPQNISFSGQVTVDGIIRVFDIGEVADVNINRIRGQHSDVFQLKGTLISPSGTEAVMFDRNCFASTDLNVGFDSDSPTDFTCPLSSGLVVKPNVTDLSVFVGEKIDGDWIFRIQDTRSGDGGQFTEFDLEICANFEIDAPYIVNNNTLEVPTGLSAMLNSDALLVGDDNNGPEELIYTVVIAPEMGSLLRDGEALSVGDQFSQQELNDGLVRYQHIGNTDGIDRFVFTVIDGEGGWLDLTEFDIFIDEDVISATDDLLEKSAFRIYPNPANNRVVIRDMEGNDRWKIRLYGMDGSVRLVSDFQNYGFLDLSSLSNGIYILNIANDKSQLSYRISVVQ